MLSTEEKTQPHLDHITDRGFTRQQQQVAELCAIHPAAGGKMRAKRAAGEPSEFCADGTGGVLMAKRKYSAHLKFADIDAAMLQWVLEMTSQKVPLSDSAIQAKAKQLAQVLGTTDFKASNGWLYKFKERHGFALKNVSKEEPRTTLDDFGAGTCGLGNYHHALLDHDPARVYSCCETSILYKKPPSFNGCDPIPTTDNSGASPDDRLTVLLCCNANGTHKIKPLVINSQRESKEVQENKSKLPVTYTWQRSSFMTSNIFQQWLWEFEKQVEHNAVLILDTCPAHVSVQSDRVKLLYVQSNMRELQPLYGGVLNMFKCKYRADLVVHYLNFPNLGNQISFLDALLLLGEAWNQIPRETIVSCWVRSQLLPVRMCAGKSHNSGDPLDQLCSSLMKVRPDITRKDVEDYLHCDDSCSTTYSFSEEAIECAKPGISEAPPQSQYHHGGCPTNLRPGEILGMLDKMEHFFTHQALTSTTDLLAIHSLRSKTIQIATNDFQSE
ncbi:hypothetical protein HPB47_020265 [Ixodes persulcatus]|uniref:Uncharacterized protein n=1 Tax=Ixodes persulcatus TaxID=34615 RepID=A0AC60QJE6_IXOPE|nr:hypothetical protein HPB47_020265 [Ixodes persulcatus]